MDEFSILMLEDSELDAELAIARLKRAGIAFRADRVASRVPFEEAIVANSYDLILSDYALPDFDGIRAMQFARQHAPDTPFIIVSGVMGEDHAISVLHAGATDYVLKRNLDRLPPAVERAIREARTAAEKRRAQELSRRILESSRDAIVTTDTRGVVLAANPAAMSCFGAAPGMQWHEIWHEHEQANAREAFEAARTGRGSQSFEAAATVPEWSETRHWSLVLTPVLDAAGHPDLILTIARDVTERKRADEERRILLARERQARTDAEEKTRQLQQSITDLEHFASAASHDLREPLRVIVMYCQLLERRADGLLDGELREYVDLIADGARRMGLLLTDLLNYSRVAHAEEELDSVDMTPVVSEALNNCSVSISEAAATVVVAALPLVRGHRAQLVQVLQNLIGNALKYRSAATPLVRISCDSAGAEWLFSVSDNGIGFDRKHAERIFGIFKRLHGSQYPGTGIGLAICRRVIERHRGRIWAEPGENGGATFYFTLPKADAVSISGQRTA